MIVEVIDKNFIKFYGNKMRVLWTSLNINSIGEKQKVYHLTKNDVNVCDLYLYEKQVKIIED